MAVDIGDKAPDFKLFDHNKNEVSLKDYESKNLVILFFPFAFSNVCTKELCNVRDNFFEYKDLEAEVIGISVDALYTLKKFHDELKLDFPLLSDFNKDISQAYGAYYEEFSYGMKGVSRRSVFVVDTEGNIRYAEILESAGDLPDLDAVLGTLTNLV
ncbi:MAG: redoxin domain-containing protein [Bacteroidetes bacterium]|nr:redoxin domain-containing protein [Bacteroidota bacterium]